MNEPTAGDPLLSLIVPVYNVEPYLEKCLDSTLSQIPSGVEIIAVDDCSPDRCGAILDAYAERDPRVQVLHLPANVGLGRARNAGIDHARGEYLWFVDGDDWLPAGALEAVTERLTVMTNPDVLIIDHVEVPDEAASWPMRSVEALREVETPITLPQRPELLRLAQSACTKVIRRSFLNEIGLRFRPGWYEDCSFSHPLLLTAKRIDVLGRVCYCYRQRVAGGITKTSSRRHFEVFSQYDWLFKLLDAKAGEYDEFRPELFRLMVNHYLVIVGNGHRVPVDMRREFFSRMAEMYQRWLPGNGYVNPRGGSGLKHRLVRRNAYRTYMALRLVYRTAATLRPLSRRRGVPQAPGP